MGMSDMGQELRLPEQRKGWQGAGRAVRLLLLALLLTASYSLIQDTIMVLLGELFYEEQLEWMDRLPFLLDSLLTLPLFFLYGWGYCYFFRGRTGAPGLSAGDFTLRHFGLCLLYALGALGISNLWFVLLEHVLLPNAFWQESLDSFSEAWDGVQPGDYPFMLFSTVLLGPVVEEILFRGLIINVLDRVRRGMMPAIVSGLLFGLFHMEPVQVVYTALLGIVLGIVYERTRRLDITITIHILNNFLTEAAGWLPTDALYEWLVLFEMLLCLPLLYSVDTVRRTGSFRFRRAGASDTIEII